MTQLTVTELAQRQGTSYALARGYIFYLIKLGRVTQVGIKNPVSVSGKGRKAKLFMFYDDKDCTIKDVPKESIA